MSDADLRKMEDTAIKRPEPLDEKLQRVTFHRDEKPHIVLDQEICIDCSIGRVCISICPAGNYKHDEISGMMINATESCMECGSCRIVCTDGAVTWDWPRGGFGVLYRHG